MFCSCTDLLPYSRETLQNIQSKKQIRINSCAFHKYFVTKLERYTKNELSRQNRPSAAGEGWTSLSVFQQFIPPRLRTDPGEASCFASPLSTPTNQPLNQNTFLLTGQRNGKASIESTEFFAFWLLEAFSKKHVQRMSHHKASLCRVHTWNV